ncbi:ABC transporter ATP-binding protein, partial [Streptomyces tendae]
HISFELPDGYFVGDLPPLAELGVSDHETDGRAVKLRTRELQRAATGLLVWAGQAGVELRRLDVRSASLEEAFLSIAKEVSARTPGTTTGTGKSKKSGKTKKEYAA